jgi:MoaA/NifB/PqqE/SkfB family radical SAM enzyme
MYALDEISADLSAFRQAVEQRKAFRPLYVKMKIIFGCNLRCEMCNHWRFNRPPPVSMERFHEVVSELAEMGCRKIHLSGGEPLLRANVPALIAHADNLGIRMTMTTNGTLVDKEMAKSLIESGLRGVNVSLDGPERKIHEAVRRVAGAFKKTTRAISLFRRYAHKGKLTLRINTVVSRLNFRSLKNLPDLVADLGADQLNLIGVDDHCGPHLSPSRRNIAEYNAEIAPHLAERGLALGLFADENQAYPFGRSEKAVKLARNGAYAFDHYAHHPCFAPWTHSLVDFDGQVFVCCMTRERIEPLGDLKTQSFRQIWEGPGYARIRSWMHPPALAACRSCDDFLAQNRQIEEMLG